MRRELPTLLFLAICFCIAVLAGCSRGKQNPSAKEIFAFECESVTDPFIGLDAAETKLGWRPLRPASHFTLDPACSEIAAGLQGDMLLLQYISNDTGARLTFSQCEEECFPGRDLVAGGPEDPFATEEVIAGFAGRVWDDAGDAGLASIVFATRVEFQGQAIYGWVLAENMKEGKTFVAALQ